MRVLILFFVSDDSGSSLSLHKSCWGVTPLDEGLGQMLVGPPGGSSPGSFPVGQLSMSHSADIVLLTIRWFLDDWQTFQKSRFPGFSSTHKVAISTASTSHPNASKHHKHAHQWLLEVEGASQKLRRTFSLSSVSIQETDWSRRTMSLVICTTAVQTSAWFLSQVLNSFPLFGAFV